VNDALTACRGHESSRPVARACRDAIGGALHRNRQARRRQMHPVKLHARPHWLLYAVLCLVPHTTTPGANPFAEIAGEVHPLLLQWVPATEVPRRWANAWKLRSDGAHFARYRGRLRMFLHFHTSSHDRRLHCSQQQHICYAHTQAALSWSGS